MYTGLYAAVSGGMAQERHLAILSNNLANVSTAGFKADKPLFRLIKSPDVVGEVSSPSGAGSVLASVDPWQGQHSVQPQMVRTYTDFSQGSLRQTGNPLDLALEGTGFFVVETPEGRSYTRQGTFTINADGVLTTQDGFVVAGEGGPIEVQGGRIEIDGSGQVSVDGGVRGRLKLVDFEQSDALRKVGHTMFRAATSELPEQEPTGLVVHQEALEGANSQPLQLMGLTIQASRAYEAYQKVIQAYDETAGRAVNDIAQKN